MDRGTSSPFPGSAIPRVRVRVKDSVTHGHEWSLTFPVNGVSSQMGSGIESPESRTLRIAHPNRGSVLGMCINKTQNLRGDRGYI